MSKARILHVINRADIGGAETYVSKLIRAMSDGDFLHLLAFTVGGQMLSRFQKQQVALYKISDYAFNYRNPVRNLLAVAELCRIVRRQRVGIIHVHVFEAYVWCTLAAWLSGVRLVQTVVSTREDAPRWTTLLERVLSAATHSFVVLSERSRSELIAQRISSHKISFIPNGIDLGELDRVERSRLPGLREELCLDGRRIIGNVGRLHWHKNQALLIHAAKRVTQAIDDVTFVIDGEGDLKEDLASLAGDLGVSEEILFTGWSPEVHALMSLFDVFVLTSLTEGVPTVVIEAMALGIPVVATDVGGVSEIIEDSKTGVLIEPGDLDGLVAAILRLLRDPSEARDLALAGQSYARQNFDMADIGRRVGRIYSRISGNGHRVCGGRSSGLSKGAA